MISDNPEWFTISEAKVTMILVLILAILDAVHHANQPVGRSGAMLGQVLIHSNVIVIFVNILVILSDAVNFSVLGDKLWIRWNIFKTIIDISLYPISRHCA